MAKKIPDDMEIVFTAWGEEEEEPDVSYNMILVDIAEEVNKGKQRDTQKEK